MLGEVVDTLVRVPHLMERVVQEDKTPGAVVEEWHSVGVGGAGGSGIVLIAYPNLINT